MNEKARFQRVEAIFQAAKRLPSDARRSFVQERSGGDRSIADEVLALLAEDERSVGALDHPPLGRAGLPPLWPEEVPLPETIGPFRVISLLGEGGMGSVYEAEQADPRRRVAVKVIRPGFASASLLHRFRRETQALAQLSHPGIARLYEAGVASVAGAQTPYFAMELVVGESITRFVQSRACAVRERLELIVSIADALEHAHQRGVIHRDLKPTNILVDERGQIRVLDFGVSRLTADAVETDDPTLLRTESGVLLGTLAYMSPEQVSGDARAVDARSDVYSLGVIAYELLTGRLPYELNRASLAESARTIREAEPSSIRSLDRSLRGDVETIVMKALAKEPARRYQSAGDLASDIRRRLSNEPIRARPASAAYRLSRFSRRHPSLVAGVAAAFAVLLVSLAVISTLLMRTVRAERTAVAERDEASVQAAIAREVNDFLVADLLAAVSPENTQDREVTLLELLDAASDRADARVFEQPAVEAEIQRTIAATYFELGRGDTALPHAQRAADRAIEAWGEDDARTHRAFNTLAQIHRSAGRFAQAEPYYARVLASRRKHPDDDPELTVRALSNLGGIYRAVADFDKAFPLLQEANTLASRTLDADSDSWLAARSMLAGAYRDAGRYADSLELCRQVLAATERKYPSGHPQIFREMNTLALVYTRLDRFEDAEPLYLACIEGQKRLLGPDHMQTLIGLSNYASMLNDADRFRDAKPILMECVERYSRTLGPDHPAALSAAFNLAKVHDSLGELDAAVNGFADAVGRASAIFGPSHPNTLTISNELIRCRLRAEQIDGLAELSGTLIGNARDALPEKHPYLGFYLMTNADVLERSGDTANAIGALREAEMIFASPGNDAYASELTRVRDALRRIQSDAGTKATDVGVRPDAS